VPVATDAVLQMDVFAASPRRGISRSPKRQVGVAQGDRPLIGVRLGIDGANRRPISYETIKVRTSLPIDVSLQTESLTVV
jgi:cysteine protease ATG4